MIFSGLYWQYYDGKNGQEQLHGRMPRTTVTSVFNCVPLVFQDVYLAAGSDRAWIDNINFPPMIITVSAPPLNCLFLR